jgi:hypothetical protein
MARWHRVPVPDGMRELTLHVSRIAPGEAEFLLLLPLRLR